MKELEQLKSMWGSTTKRSTNLIVPKVTFSNNKGSLNNEHWAYEVTYAFRDALDIKYEKRKKDKEAYMVWTQGPILRFKEGDTLFRRNRASCLQVLFATGAGWDPEKNEMDTGIVTYNDYIIVDGEYILADEVVTCCQMKFLQRLIYGS